jgi:hypothetical protein
MNSAINIKWRAINIIHKNTHIITLPEFVELTCVWNSVVSIDSDRCEYITHVSKFYFELLKNYGVHAHCCHDMWAYALKYNSSMIHNEVHWCNHINHYLYSYYLNLYTR